MPPDPPRLGVLCTPSLSTFINHHASKAPLLVKKNPPFKIPGYGPGIIGAQYGNFGAMLKNKIGSIIGSGLALISLLVYCTVTKSKTPLVMQAHNDTQLYYRHFK